MRKEYNIVTIGQFFLRLAFVFGFILIVSFFCFVNQSPAFDENADGLGISVEDPEDIYGNCPNPQDVCDTFDPGSIAVEAYGYEENFERCDGEEITIKAIGHDDFPQTWFVWHEGTMTPSGDFECILTPFGKKTTLLEIPVSGYFICKAILETSNHKYHIHFASNPNSGCLGWVQCMEY